MIGADYVEQGYKTFSYDNVAWVGNLDFSYNVSGYGTVGEAVPPFTAFNAFGEPAKIVTPPNSTFSVSSMVAAPVWTYNLTLRLCGFDRDHTKVADHTHVLADPFVAQTIDLGDDFANLVELEMITSGGIHAGLEGKGTHVAFDFEGCALQPKPVDPIED